MTGTVIDALQAAQLEIADRDAYLAGPPKQIVFERFDYDWQRL